MTQNAIVTRSTGPSRRRVLRRRIGRTGWVVMTVLCFATLALVAPYLQFNPTSYFEEQRPVYLRREVTLGLHICGSMVALAIAPFQLLPRLRRRRARVHRVLGFTYLTAATVGGLAGLGMATTAYTGTVASLGFAAMAISWLACTWVGFRLIMRGRIADHRRWMIRSISLVLGGVTLRLILGTYSAVENSIHSWLPFSTIYAATAWLCWVPNLLIALRITRTSAQVPRSRPSESSEGRWARARAARR